MFKPYPAWEKKIKSGLQLVLRSVSVNKEYLVCGLSLMWVGFTDLLGVTRYPKSRL